MNDRLTSGPPCHVRRRYDPDWVSFRDELHVRASEPKSFPDFLRDGYWPLGSDAHDVYSIFLLPMTTLTFSAQRLIDGSLWQ